MASPRTLEDKKGDDYEPSDDDRLYVTVASAQGHSKKAMCIRLGIRQKQLEHLFPHELELGSELLTGKVATNLTKIALSDKVNSATVTACVTILTHQGGWIKAEIPKDKSANPNLTLAKNLNPVQRKQVIANILKKGEMITPNDIPIDKDVH